MKVSTDDVRRVITKSSRFVTTKQGELKYSPNFNMY